MSGATKLLGQIERIAIAGRRVEVQGWVFAFPDGPVPRDIVLLHHGAIVARCVPGSLRQLPNRPGPVRCGFLQTIMTMSDDLDESGFGLGLPDGPVIDLILPPPQPIALTPRGRIESIDGMTVSGWLHDTLDETARPSLECDGSIVPITVLLPRPDLVEAGLVPKAEVGFSVTLPQGGSNADVGEQRARVVNLVSGSWLVDSTRADGLRLTLDLTRAAQDGIRGVLGYRNRPQQPTGVDIRLDGAFLQRLAWDDHAAHHRDPRTGLRPIDLHWGPHAVAADPFGIVLTDPETGLGVMRAVRRSAPVQAPDPIVLRSPRSGSPPTLVILVRRDSSQLGAVLEALRQHTTHPCDLVLLAPEAADRDLQSLLADAGLWPFTQVVRPTGGQSAAERLNAAILAAKGDVVLLDSEVEVGPRWLENLLIVARSGPRVGTVSALVASDGDVPATADGNAEGSSVSADRAGEARQVMQAAACRWPEQGLGDPACVLISRDCFLDTGGLGPDFCLDDPDRLAHFCIRALRLGWTHVLDDRTWVLCRRGDQGHARRHAPAGLAAPDRAEAPERAALIRHIGSRSDLAAIRLRARTAAGLRETRPRPRILFVTSTQTGGTPLTNADLMTALGDDHDPLLLVCDTRTLRLTNARDGNLLEQRSLSRPIDPVLHRSAEYDRVVTDWLVRYAVELVHIRHLAWHGLGLPQVCAELGIPSVLSLHDFYTACPNVKLLDERDRHCAGRCTDGPGDCTSELWPQDQMPRLKHSYVHVWRQAMTRAIEPCARCVTTSASAARLLSELLPSVAGRMVVIPHGRDFAGFRAPAPALVGNEPFRILVAGSISAAKGLRLIVRAAEVLAAEGVEIHVLGRTEPGIDPGPLIQHGLYKRDAFIERAQRIKPQIGLAPAIWPETYSHVLTEMWAAGLPVLGGAIGAIGERIGQTGAGWLFDPLDPDALIAALRRIRTDPEDLVRRKAAVTAWQNGEALAQNVIVMAARYRGLYADVLNERRTLLSRRAD